MSDSALLANIVSSGVSVATATTVTSPFDVIKVRMQLANARGERSLGLVGTSAHVVKSEGFSALWKGLPPAIMRGLFYGGLRLGLYDPMKALVQPLMAAPTQPTNTANASSPATATTSTSSNPLPTMVKPGFGVKLLCGVASGSIAAVLSSPLELIKTRMQAPGAPPTSVWGVVSQVVRAEGVTGLWRGAVPGMVRAAILTASQCATYDEAKRAVMAASGWGDHAGTHLVVAMMTGVVTTTATQPVDVIKTIMFVSGNKYRSPLSCAADLALTSGPRGFMRGWTANYLRLGPQTVVTFVVVEQLRRLAGLNSL